MNIELHKAFDALNTRLDIAEAASETRHKELLTKIAHLTALLERTNLQVHGTADRVHELQAHLVLQSLSPGIRAALAAEDKKPRTFMPFSMPDGTTIMMEVVDELPRDDESSGEGMDDEELYADVINMK